MRVVDEDGGEAPLTAALPAGMVADALAVLAAAGGDAEADTVAARAIVRATTADVLERLEGATTVTVHDLSTLVEAALIASGYFDVAKALVLRRALPTTSTRATVRLIRRSGEVAGWSTVKIEVAIRKAFLSLGLESEPAVALAARVGERAHALGTAYVPIETVQDIVQEELVLAGHMRVAERYIVYRAERAMLRARSQVEPAAPVAIPVRRGLRRRDVVDRRRPARADRVRVDRALARARRAALWSASCGGRSGPGSRAPTSHGSSS